ncbi:alpha/beta fold hydrolase [Sphingomonas sp. RT2P30]|uniref:alpha/beta hydrolase n=1 Tax=Parasphingomonas halimpatiens TaxID=3096162 RepID=UPI002FC67252
MRALRRFLLGATLFVAALYIAVLAGLYVKQRDLIYPGAGGHRGLVASEVDFEEVMLTTADGLHLRALYRAPRAGMPTVLMFHGNGHAVSGSAAAMRPLIGDGYGLLLSEYRGFGGNPGKPSEQGLYRDARAAWGWLRAKGVAPDRIVLLGYSLGSGVAAQLALEHPPRALVLVAGYTGIAHVTGQHYPWIPAEWLVTERFRTIDKLPRIACPILLLHGRDDETIPADNSIALAKERPDAKLELVAGTGHGIIYRDDTMRRIDAWLKAAISVRTSMDSAGVKRL